jgi:hypothetical protein
MTRGSASTLYWAPRILGILAAAFISLFALDAFTQGYSAWEAVLAFLIHLVPTYLVVIALVLAWRWERVGAALFIGLGASYVIWAWGRFDLIAYLVVSGPLVVTGVLFLLAWMYAGRRYRIRPESDSP